MSNSNPMAEIFIFETSRLLEQLEEIMLESERAGALSAEGINEIFRTMHTIKGSSAMMRCDNVSQLAHAVEDLFYYLRENRIAKAAFSDVVDFVLRSSDFIKAEIAKIMNGLAADGDPGGLSNGLREYVKALKAGEPAPKPRDISPADTGYTRYRAHVTFDGDCRMENIRAFGLVHSMKDLCSDLTYQPEDLLGDEGAAEAIRKSGFELRFTTGEDPSNFEKLFDQTMFLTQFTLQPCNDAEPERPAGVEKRDNLPRSARQGQIGVNIAKLDSLMDLVGEIVITESTVTHNSDLDGLRLDNFRKAARQLDKLMDDLQDLVMSVRMIPVANTFRRMTRIVRDMGRKLDKEADLAIVGEETEVDKNIIDNLSDPLMHLIRNAMDHGLETPGERRALGKPEAGHIRLEAVNTGADVLITVSDDGRGLDREKILKKAREKNLLAKPESEMTDLDVCGLLLLPGFSTKEEVTEFSGRGVGMDVVRQNTGKVGGSVSINSAPGRGTTVTIRIPLTPAIVKGWQRREAAAGLR